MYSNVKANSIGQGEGITIPSWLFFLGLGLGVGVLTGPAIMASTKTGAESLAEIARKKLAR